MNGEQYVHRVGRTARAGQSGRAIIMLTEREKYFLRVNKSLPIKPYTVNISATATQLAPTVANAMYQVDDLAKSKAYQAYLGFHKTFMKQLQLDTMGLVAMANEYAAAMGCPEPPVIDKSVVGKMGLRGTRGLNVGIVARNGPGRGQGSNTRSTGGSKQNGAAQASDPQRPNGGRGRGRGRGGKMGGSNGDRSGRTVPS